MKARSGPVIWGTVIALLAGTAVVAASFGEFDGIGSWLTVLLILAASAALTGSFVLRNCLLVTEEEIKVCFGITTTVVKTASVTALKKVKNLTASASASAKRIEIRHAGGVLYVSPKEEDEFIRTVCAYHPQIRVE